MNKLQIYTNKNDVDFLELINNLFASWKQKVYFKVTT